VQINYGKIKHSTKQARVLEFGGGAGGMGRLEASQVFNLDVGRSF
jgi:hypothetical protein